MLRRWRASSFRLRRRPAVKRAHACEADLKRVSAWNLGYGGQAVLESYRPGVEMGWRQAAPGNSPAS